MFDLKHVARGPEVTHAVEGNRTALSRQGPDLGHQEPSVHDAHVPQQNMLPMPRDAKRHLKAFSLQEEFRVEAKHWRYGRAQAIIFCPGGLGGY